jgi:hypothetical protein
MIRAYNQSKRSFGLSVKDLRAMSLDELKLEFTKWHMLSLESETLKQKATCEAQKNKIQKIIFDKREGKE